MTLLVIADYYLPGWKAGGPIRSIGNMVEALGDRFEFLVLTRDHDYTDRSPYGGIVPGKWVRVGKAHVFYGRPRHLGLGRIARLIRQTQPTMICANSLFSTMTLKVLVLRWMRRIDRVPLLIAPRGELGFGALSYKRARKRIFLLTARLLGWFSGVRWQASTPAESAQIERWIKGAIPFIAADLPQTPGSEPVAPPHKASGSVRFVFSARISPMKNLPFLLRSLRDVSGDVTLDIYGAAEVGEWHEVERLFRSMPKNIIASYHGAVRPEEIEGALAQGHFLILSTRGENFGHSIYEALRIGRPVVVSDRTPWQGLADGNAGWSVPLESLEEWTRVLQRCVDIDEDEFRQLVAGAFSYARHWYETTRPAERQAEVFEELMQVGHDDR